MKHRVNLQQRKVKARGGGIFSGVTHGLVSAGAPFLLMREGEGGWTLGCGPKEPPSCLLSTLILACSLSSSKLSSWKLPRRTRPSMRLWALCRMRSWAWPTVSWNPSPPRLCTAPSRPSVRSQAGPGARSSSCLPNTWPTRRSVGALDSVLMAQDRRAGYRPTAGAANR